MSGRLWLGLGVDVEAQEVGARPPRSPLVGRAVDLFFSWATRRPFGDPSSDPSTCCKAVFDRPKDWLDIEAMLAFTEPLDLDAIRSWLTRMVGPEDARLESSALVARLEL